MLVELRHADQMHQEMQRANKIQRRATKGEVQKEDDLILGVRIETRKKEAMSKPMPSKPTLLQEPYRKQVKPSLQAGAVSVPPLRVRRRKRWKWRWPSWRISWPLGLWDSWAFLSQPSPVSLDGQCQ